MLINTKLLVFVNVFPPSPCLPFLDPGWVPIFPMCRRNCMIQMPAKDTARQNGINAPLYRFSKCRRTARIVHQVRVRLEIHLDRLQPGAAVVYGSAQTRIGFPAHDTVSCKDVQVRVLFPNAQPFALSVKRPFQCHVQIAVDASILVQGHVSARVCSHNVHNV